MITKLNNHAFQESIYDILRDTAQNCSTVKVDTGIFDGEFRIRYRKNSKETTYYLYISEEDMISDFTNYTFLKNKIKC